MNRRRFGRAIAETMVGSFCAGSNASAFHRAATSLVEKDQRPPFGLSVMLWTFLPNLPFEERLEKIAEAGYRNVELVGEYVNWTEAQFQRANDKRRELGIQFDCTAGLKHGVSIPADREALVLEMRRVLPIMERLECPGLILLSGDRLVDVPRQIQHQACIDTLSKLASLVQGRSINGEPVQLFLETIDPEENPKCFLTQVNEALEVVAAVGHPQVKLLYDFYHEQIAGGNLIVKLEKSISHLGLVHVADVPGRHEPGTGEINYRNILHKLAELKYMGRVAMEFHPSGDSVQTLRSAREMALS